MKRLKSVDSALYVLGLYAFIAYSNKLPAQKLRRLADRQIETPVGKMAVSALQVKRGGFASPTRLTGLLGNETTRTWDVFTVCITAIEKGATRNDLRNNITFQSVEPKQWKEFYFDIAGKIDFPSLEYKVDYVSGSYQATYNFRLIHPRENSNLVYSDETFKFLFAPRKSQIDFEITNSGSSVALLDWDKTAFVEPSGESKRVIGAGMRYIDLNSHRPPSVIPPGARLADSIIPTDRVRFMSGVSVDNLFPDCPNCLIWANKTFGIHLCLQHDGQEHHYDFKFQVYRVE